MKIDFIQYAVAYHDMGLNPLPVDPQTKRPTIEWKQWQTERVPRADLMRMFHGAPGIGVVGGEGSGGFEVLDIERRALDTGVFDRLSAAAATEIENWHEIMSGWFVETRSGGVHIGWRVDGVDGNTKLAMTADNEVLIETRGQGGQAVCPPTVAADGRWEFGRPGKPYIPTITVEHRDLIFEVARSLDQSPVRSVQADRITPIVPAASSPGEHPGDWVRENLGVNNQLIEAGWTQTEARGGDVWWCRPDKNPRDGHSAVVHDDEVLVCWSTSVDASFERAGRHNADGSSSLSPLEVYAAIHCGGNVRDAMSKIRREVMPERDEDPILSSIGVGQDRALEEPAVEGPSGDLNLPDEFWEARPYLAHIRQAADSRLVSPDALLLSVVARFAALIPPNLQLPAIIGSSATFDWLGCVVSTSSGGKTISNGVAADLLANIRTDVLMDASPGSGEGLIQAFMGYERDEKGKPVGDPSYKFGKYSAVHLTVDEGTGLMEQQARKGTTIVQTLCSAWSGAGLGQLNASTETKRLVPARKRRVSATVNIQTAFGHTLLGEPMRHIGLPQRLLFAWAHSQPVETPPDWPGELDLPRLTTSAQVTHLGIDQQVIDDVISHRKIQMAGTVVLDELDGHLMLARLKLAGIFALMEDRRNLTQSDWDLTHKVVSSHHAVRSKLLNVKSEADRRTIEAQGTAQGLREVAALDVKERQKIARISDRIAGIAGKDGLSYSKARKQATYSENRHLFDEALAHAVERGAVEVVDISGTGQPGRVVRAT